MENEFVVKKELQEKRKEIKNFDSLIEFLKDVKENYNTGYGEAPRAMAQACLAVGDFLAKDFGITGFQASFVMWDFILDWRYKNNKCGLCMVNFDDMLYPQYGYKFAKTISAERFEKIKEQAKENLEKNKCAHPDVIKHWKSIVNGEIPFGFTISEKEG